MELIDKSAVVAEIERRIFEDYNSGDEEMEEVDEAVKGALASLRYFIDTLEVKEVNDELASEFDRCGLIWQDIKDIAEIGNNFMNSDESNDLNEEEYYTEILKRFLGKKGDIV